MKKHIGKIVATIMLALVFALGLIGCAAKNQSGGDGSNAAYYVSIGDTVYTAEGDIPTDKKFVKGESGDYTLTISLNENDEFVIRSIGSDVVIGYSAVTGTSLAAGADGKIKAKGAGEYSFVFDDSGDPMLIASYSKAGGSAESATKYVTSVTIDSDDFTLGINKTKKLTGTVHYSDGSTDGGVVWNSVDEGVASVSDEGLVTAVSEGFTFITVSCATEPEISAAVKVTGAVIEVSGITLDKQEWICSKGDTVTLSAIVAPEDATDKNYSWSSSDAATASVDTTGKVTANNSGIAVITATTVNNGKTAECKVVVKTPLVGIYAAPLNMHVGDEKEASLSFTPSADNVDKTFDAEVTSGGQYITIEKTDENGLNSKLKITALDAGNAVITITSKDDATITATLNVSVYAEGAVFANISEQKIELRRSGDAATKKLSVSLVGADIKSVTWASDNAYATVTADTDTTKATVTGAKLGKATITATITYDDDSGVEQTVAKTCDVLVTDEYYSLMVADSAWTYEGGNTIPATAAEAASRNLLLTQTGEGVYEITRHFNKSDYIQITSNSQWNQNEFGGNHKYSHDSGLATVKVTINGSGCKQSITPKADGYDLASVTIAVTAGAATLNNIGDAVTYTYAVAPSGAGFTDSDVSVEITTAASTLTLNSGNLTATDNCVSFTLDMSAKTIVGSYNAYVTSNTTYTVTITVKDKTASSQVIAMAQGQALVMPTLVTFTYPTGETTYFTTGKTITVVAIADTASGDATDKTVTYTLKNAVTGVTIDGASGVVTADDGFIGSVTVVATANGDNSVKEEAQVGIYPDVNIDGQRVDKSWGNTDTLVFDKTNNTYTLSNVMLNADSRFYFNYNGLYADSPLTAAAATAGFTRYNRGSGNDPKNLTIGTNAAGIYEFVFTVASDNTVTCVGTKTGELQLKTITLYPTTANEEPTWKSESEASVTIFYNNSASVDVTFNATSDKQSSNYSVVFDWKNGQGYVGAYDGDAYSATSTNGKWYAKAVGGKYDGQVQYIGAYPAGKTFRFTIALDGDGNISTVTIAEVA